MIEIKKWRYHLRSGLAAILLVNCFGSPVQAADVLAYVGPGAGLGMLGALAAVVGVLILGLLGPILYPLRAILRKRRARQQGEVPEENESDAAVTVKEQAE